MEQFRRSKSTGKRETLIFDLLQLRRDLGDNSVIHEESSSKSSEPSSSEKKKSNWSEQNGSIACEPETEPPKIKESVEAPTTTFTKTSDPPLKVKPHKLLPRSYS